MIQLRPDTNAGHGYDAWLGPLGCMLSLQTEVMNTKWNSQWIGILASSPNTPVVLRKMITEPNYNKYPRP